MRLNTAIVVSFVTLAIGLIFGEQHLWIPASVLAAAAIDLFTRQWVVSDRLGSSRNLSSILKFIFALIGFYAMLGQIACIVLVISWFVI